MTAIVGDKPVTTPGGRVSALLGTYIGSNRDRELQRALELLLSHLDLIEKSAGATPRSVGRFAEARALMLLGNSGAGKTRALERAFSLQPEFAPPWAGGKLVSIKAPAPCTLRQLGNAVLDGFGYIRTRELRESVVWDVVRTQIRHLGVRFLHVDELHHLFEATDRNQVVHVRNTLKNLMQLDGWPVFLILSGLPMMSAVFEEDPQVWRRKMIVRFAPITIRDRNTVQQALEHLATKTGLMTAVAEEVVVPRLLHASRNEFGSCIELIQDAIREAIETEAESLTLDHFAAVHGRMSGCEPEANPFLVSN